MKWYPGTKDTMVNVKDNYNYILLYHWLECFSELKVSSFIGAYHYRNILDNSLEQSDFKEKVKLTGS